MGIFYRLQNFAPVLIWVLFLVMSIVLNAKKVSKKVQKTPMAPKAEFKAPVEKTHSHKGEVSHTVLLEDREHDWLANQIREEVRLGRKKMQ